MAPYNTPQAIRPLEKTICDFAYSNGYDPISVFNDFLRYVIHGFSPGAPPLMDWKYKRQQNRHFMEMLTGWIRLMQRNCNPADGLMRSVTSSWQYLPKSVGR